MILITRCALVIWEVIYDKIDILQLPIKLMSMFLVSTISELLYFSVPIPWPPLPSFLLCPIRCTARQEHIYTTWPFASAQTKQVACWLIYYHISMILCTINMCIRNTHRAALISHKICGMWCVGIKLIINIPYLLSSPSDPNGASDLGCWR